jgi:hypothetical protein
VTYYAPDPPVDQTPCRMCGGKRYLTELDHDPHCRVDGSSACASSCPIEVEYACPDCGPVEPVYVPQFQMTPDETEEVPF